MNPIMVSTSDPLVSVILPTFNRAHTLTRAIQSVLNQSYRNIELLVVDDASTDNTAEVVAAISDPRVHYLPQPVNGGASFARNAGMRAATGAFLAFQDSDDEWLGDKLVKQVAAAVEAEVDAVTVFHTKILYGRDSDGRYGPQKVCCLPLVAAKQNPDFCRLIQKSNLVSPQALLISRAAFEKAGFFDEDLVNNEDWALGIDLFYSSKVVFLDEPLVMTYLQGDSISTLMRKGARAQLRVVQKIRKLPDLATGVVGNHLGRIGWGIAKLGHPRRARKLLGMALRLEPLNWRNWARALVNEGRIIRALVSPARSR